MSRICLARAASSLIGMETSVERMASVDRGRFWTRRPTLLTYRAEAGVDGEKKLDLVFSRACPTSNIFFKEVVGYFLQLIGIDNGNSDIMVNH